MSKKIQLAVAAALAMGATAAQAGITIPAGDWTIDIGGNVNAYYTHTTFSSDFDNVAKNAPRDRNANMISTGLLPSALGVGGKTRQNDLDIAFQFTFFTGANSCGGMGSSSGLYNCNGADGNSLNIRQAYMTFGDKSWGTIKAGRDLGIFGSDAILSDMTLLGVGTGAGGAGSSTLGRIGSGYLYADWVGQISYQSPNWNGFSFAVGLREPWGNSANGELGYEGKVSYEWAGDVSGKVWLGAVSQKTRDVGAAYTAYNYTAGGGITTVTATRAAASDRSSAWEIGGKVAFGGLGLVGYYYDGKNIGVPIVARGNTPVSGLLYTVSPNGKDHDVKGGYIQATYTLPGAGTKIGASWGESKYENNSLDGTATDDFTNRSWILGVYHPLTKSLNLVAEYTDTKYENIGLVNNFDGKARTVALGAILFF